MRGRNGKARAGRVVGQGRAPYGYHYENDSFVIDELEAQTIQMIFDLYVNGDENGRSMSCRMRVSRSSADAGTGWLESAMTCSRGDFASPTLVWPTPQRFAPTFSRRTLA